MKVLPLHCKRLDLRVARRDRVKWRSLPSLVGDVKNSIPIVLNTLTLKVLFFWL